jgi:hypothetical protein
MKNLFFLLCFLGLPFLVFAQNTESRKGKVIKKELKKRKIVKDKNIEYIRPIAIKVDGGWNAIAGAGFITSIYTSAHLAFDFGVGYGFKGFKYGVQSRYLLNTKNHTPYFGLGVSKSMSASNRINSNATFIDADGTVTQQSMIYSVNNVNHLRLSMGYEFFRKKGFVLDASVGYAWVLNPVLNIFEGGGDRIEQEFDFLYGNGVIYTVSLGYSFRFKKK